MTNEGHTLNKAAMCATILLCALAVLYVLRVTRDYVIPVVIAILLSVLLQPVVRRLKAVNIPRGVAAAMILILLVGGFVTGVTFLISPANEWLSQAPKNIEKLDRKASSLKRHIAAISRTAEQMEDISNGGKKNRKEEVKVDTSGKYILHWTHSFVTGAVVMFVMLFFFLARGDDLARSCFASHPSKNRSDEAKKIYSDIEHNVGAYLLTITFINIGLGLAVGTALHFGGLPNAVFWGAVAACVNFIPYVGSLCGIAMVAMASLMALDGGNAWLLPPALYSGLVFLEGYFLTPAILGRRFAVNPIFVFVFLIFWGGLWGVFGALLAMPFLVTLKIVSAHLPSMARVEQMLES